MEDIAARKGIPICEPFQGAQIGAFTVMAPSRALFFDMVVASDKTPEPVKESALYSLGGVMVEAAQKVVALVKMAWGDERFSVEETAAENEMSVVQYANLCGRKILLTGDTGRKGLQEVINFAPAAGLILPGIDRFQVPHHGSRRNVTTEILNQLLGPKSSSQTNSAQFTAIISSAKADEKHPRKAVVRAMHHRGAKVVQTEGVSIRTSQFAPNRGWTAAVPVPYPEDQED